MKRLALSILSATAVAVGTAGIAAPPASALFETCSGPAATGCASSAGTRWHIESRSSKTGGAASYICTQLSAVTGLVANNCAYEGTFIRLCYYGGQAVIGTHSGSSNAWIVDGRDATVGDATTC